jgi:hypothetical protein
MSSSRINALSGARPRMISGLRVSSLALITLIISSLGCQDLPPVHDPIQGLLGAMSDGSWTALADRFSPELPMEAFPLKRDLEGGWRWAGVQRARLMDHHLIFDVDLAKTQEGREIRLRYTFWAVAPESLSLGKNQDVRVGAIVGWSEPRTPSESLIGLEEIEAPPRFSATSFRGVPRVEKLGVLGVQTYGAIAEGWWSEVSPYKIKSRAHKRRGCAKIKLKKIQPVLTQSINQDCSAILIGAAQLSYRLDETRSKKRKLVDVSEGRGRADDTLTPPAKEDVTALENGVQYGGQITLELDLSQDGSRRHPPVLVENMLISPDFTQCVRRATLEWAQTFISRKDCTLRFPLLFKVYRPQSDLSPSSAPAPSGRSLP